MHAKKPVFITKYMYVINTNQISMYLWKSFLVDAIHHDNLIAAWRNHGTTVQQKQITTAGIILKNYNEGNNYFSPIHQQIFIL